MISEPNKIEIVFADLQSKGLLSPNRKLRLSKFTPNFRSALLFYNTISYNPKFCGMQEENIRFCLLHEEGHKIKPQYGPPCLISFSIFILIPFILMEIFFRDYPILVFSTLVYSIILIFLSLAALKNSFHDDEFDSDFFAAEIIRDSYGIKKPSYILYNTLTELHSIMNLKHSGKITLSEKLMVGFVFVHLHPSLDDRVKKIARLVDCY